MSPIPIFFLGDRIIFTGKRNVVETPKDNNVKIIQSPQAALKKKLTLSPGLLREQLIDRL